VTSAFERLGAAHDFHQLFGDSGLAGPVVLQVRRSIISVAFLVALPIAVMRAPNSEAIDSSKG